MLYLIFNEGYAATQGRASPGPTSAPRLLWLGRVLVELLPDSEALGLLALMLLPRGAAGRPASVRRRLVLLEDQDLGHAGDRGAIPQAQALLDWALASRHVGPHVLQAAIARPSTSSSTELE